MSSELYEGWVRHRRLGAVEHSFRYRLYMTLSGEGPVKTLEMPRSFGVGFNPVRFRYRMEGDEVGSMAAEVTNTPVGRAAHLRVRGAQRTGGQVAARLPLPRDGSRVRLPRHGTR